MTTLMIIGATGLVGRAALDQARVDPRVTRIVAPTRRPLALTDATGHNAPQGRSVDNPIVDFAALPLAAPWWDVDAVVCALGTTRRQAGSAEAFRKVDFDHVLAVARAAHAHGARTFVLTSAVGADPGSRFLYFRTKGEIEGAIAALGFASFTAVRPAGLTGERASARRMEQISNGLARALSFLLPRRYRVVSAARVAKTLLAAALEVPAGHHIIPSEAIAA